MSIPYAIFALLFGLLWGIIGYYEKWFEEKVEFCRKSLNGMLAILIPTMLFQKGFCIDAHAFLKALPQILIISIAGIFHTKQNMTIKLNIFSFIPKCCCYWIIDAPSNKFAMAFDRRNSFGRNEHCYLLNNNDALVSRKHF